MTNLTKLRKLKEKTQSQMASYLGISQQAYATYENDRAQPPLDILQKLADYFNVTVDYLLGREAKTTDTPETEDSDDIRMIQRARKKMSPQDKEKMMCVLKTIFEEAFDDDNKQN